ncbi:unnamed protein product [Albugo candida]|uniref:Uncharacterized protein n=1 Tax=Albugo candida TaxID=65357 RepID=A0A024FVW2_9STRA|nr:unnamed protein product [Albugo candida]|eukprot:CCI11270.1 unnamed protein product [Albugo candida]
MFEGEVHLATNNVTKLEHDSNEESQILRVDGVWLKAKEFLIISRPRLMLHHLHHCDQFLLCYVYGVELRRVCPNLDVTMPVLLYHVSTVLLQNHCSTSVKTCRTKFPSCTLSTLV